MSQLIFNSATLEAWKEIDPLRWKALVLEIMQIFFENAPTQYTELLRAIDQKDWETAQRLAHSLKSSCGNVGAESSHFLLNQIEQKCEHDVAAVKALSETLAPVFAEALAQMGNFRKQLQAV